MLENITNTNNRKKSKAKEGYANLPKQITNLSQASNKMKEEIYNDYGTKTLKNNDTVIVKAIPYDSIKQRKDSQASFKENSPSKNNISSVSKQDGTSLFMNNDHK
jgi:hypothetical protein